MNTQVEVEMSDEQIVTAEVNYSIVDGGIGAYEYWGFCGSDHHAEVEIYDIRIVKIMWADEDGNPYEVSDKEMEKEILESSEFCKKLDEVLLADYD